MNNCPHCNSTNALNYFTKPDGDIDVEYWRCNDCLEIWAVKVEHVSQ